MFHAILFNSHWQKSLSTVVNKAIRDGRPRPPRHQVGWDIPLHFDTNPESLRPFVPEIWPNNVFNLSATYDLDLWPKILKIFVSHGVPIRNMYAKFHNDRLRNGWDIRLWNFAKTRTNTQTNTQTHKQTDMGITIPRPPPMGGEVIIGLCMQPHYSNGTTLNRCIEPNPHYCSLSNPFMLLQTSTQLPRIITCV